MATSKGLANQTVVINDETWGYVPDSLKTTLGFGEKNVRAETIGPNTVNHIVTSDNSTKIGMTTLEVYNKAEAIDLIRELNSADGQISIQLAGDKPLSMAGATLVNDPEISFSSDGTISLEFKGGQIV